MDKEEFINHLTEDFPFIYYYIRLYQKVSREKAIKDFGKIKEDSDVILRSIHFSTLWLVEALSKKNGVCLGNKLAKLVLRKHSIKTKRRFGERVLDPLEAVGFIDRRERFERTTIIKITQRGQHFLKELKKGRKENVDKLIALMDIPKESYESFAKSFHKISNLAWERIQEEAFFFD